MIDKLVRAFKRDQEPTLRWWTSIEPLQESKDLHPQPASNFLPQWFKDSSTGYIETVRSGTAKACPSFSNLFSLGYTVPMWCDSYLWADGQGNWRFKTSYDKFSWEAHGDSQFKNLLTSEISESVAHVLKPTCPWNLEITKGYSVLIIQPFLHFNNNFSIIPGIIHSEFYHDINTPLYLHKKGDWILIPRGYPLFTVIPIKREVYNSVVDDYTKELSKKKSLSDMIVLSKFKRGYKEEARNRNIKFKYNG